MIALITNPLSRVVLVTLFGDSLHSIMPRYTADTYKLLGLILYVERHTHLCINTLADII